MSSELITIAELFQRPYVTFQALAMYSSPSDETNSLYTFQLPETIQKFTYAILVINQNMEHYADKIHKVKSNYLATGKMIERMDTITNSREKIYPKSNLFNQCVYIYTFTNQA